MPGKIAATAVVAGSIAGLVLWSDATLAADPIGTWFTAGNRSQVRIARCGNDALCGGIVWLKDPNNPNTGKPWTDIHNPDPAKRTRPLIGVRIVLDLTTSNTPDKWQGQAYNADDGRTYSGYLTMTGPNA